MIIEEKHMHPDPPAYRAHSSPPPPFTASGSSGRKDKLNFGTLPSHILLQIVYCTFPQCDGQYEGEGKIERQRMNLHWLVTSLRLVNRALYIASMHILRSTYLPAYNSLVKHPYTSNPFPSASSLPSTSPKESIFSSHRELATLDSFIALLAHEDLMLDSTALHLPREEAYSDIFDRMQPGSRLEDLVRQMGVQDAVVFDGDPAEYITKVCKPTHSPTLTVAPAEPSPPSPSRSTFSFSSIKASLSRSKRSSVNSTPPSPIPQAVPDVYVPVEIRPVSFAFLSVSFTPRRVSLVYSAPSKAMANADAFRGSDYGALSLSVSGPTGPAGRKKAIVEVVRERRDEPLEICAKKLVQSLREYLEEDAAQ